MPGDRAVFLRVGQNVIAPRALAIDDLYPAVMSCFDLLRQGSERLRVLDVPAGQGAFAKELLQHGCAEIKCLDINQDAFVLEDGRVKFTQHDVIAPLPFPDAYFDHVFSVEGIEHFESPWTFVKELCRVLKPGGCMLLSTPNTFSVDARLKYLLSGYFPRFRPLMLEPHKVMDQPVDDAHIAPIYFWQLNYFLGLGGLDIEAVSTNALIKKPRWINRVIEAMIAATIRRNIVRRRFPDLGVSSEAMLFGDCLIVVARKRPASAA